MQLQWADLRDAAGSNCHISPFITWLAAVPNGLCAAMGLAILVYIIYSFRGLSTNSA